MKTNASRIAVLAAVAALGTPWTGAAQRNTLEKSVDIGHTDYEAAYVDFLASRKAQSLLPAAGLSSTPYSLDREVVLDKSVDPQEYRLGTGDVLTACIWGDVEKTYELVVNTEGKIVIPLVGVLDVKGKTLAVARELVRREVLGAYKRVEIVITLSSIREFRAYILGEVAMPGLHRVDGASRVSDLVEFAGGITERGRERCIEIANETYGSRTADLASFSNSNCLDGNPYLLEGDRVFVAPGCDVISVHGYVNHPGQYDYCTGDKARNALLAAGGFTRGVDSSAVVLTRFVDDLDSLVTIIVGIDEVDDFDLEPDDRLLVRGIPKYRVDRVAVVTGEVNYPGVYPIRKDKTRLADVIASAGGLTEDALLAESKIVRERPAALSSDGLVYLKTLPSGALGPIEMTRLKSALMEEDGRMVIDLSAFFADQAGILNVILRHGDRIIIARRDLTVRVMGAVATPGLVPFLQGKSVRYYIRQAGGYTDRSVRNGVRVARAGTENGVRPRVIREPGAGDVIIVPERLYRDRLQVTKDVLLVLSSVATVVTSFVAVHQYLSRD